MRRAAPTPRRPPQNAVGQRILYVPCCNASRPKLVPQAYSSDPEFVEAVAALPGNKTIETLTLEDLALLSHTAAGMDMIMKYVNHHAAHHQRELACIEVCSLLARSTAPERPEAAAMVQPRCFSAASAQHC